MDERAIFFEAVERDDPAERAAYLDEACAGDPALRRRVEALLQSHATAGDFLDMPAAEQLVAGAGMPADRGCSDAGHASPDGPKPTSRSTSWPLPGGRIRSAGSGTTRC